jgi:hypothetical protein
MATKSSIFNRMRLQSKFFLLFLSFLTQVLSARAQSENSNQHFSLDAAYIFSTLANENLGNSSHEEIPFGTMALIKYKLSDTWSIEAGINFRVRPRISIGPGDCPVGSVPFHYTTWFLDLPVRAELHAFGQKKFNFNLLGGIKETWRFYNVHLDTPMEGMANYVDRSQGTGIILGFKESYRISPRIKLCIEQTNCYYFAGKLKGASGVEVKLGIEYLFNRAL